MEDYPNAGQDIVVAGQAERDEDEFFDLIPAALRLRTRVIDFAGSLLAVPGAHAPCDNQVMVVSQAADTVIREESDDVG